MWWDDEDESIWEMIKGYIKTILGILMFILVITLFSNFDSIQRWIENFFSR